MAEGKSLLEMAKLAASALNELSKEAESAPNAVPAVMQPSAPEEGAAGTLMEAESMEPENMDPECMAAEIPLGDSATPRESLQIPETLQRPKTISHTLSPLQRSLVLSEVLGRPVALRGRNGRR